MKILNYTLVAMGIAGLIQILIYLFNRFLMKKNNTDNIKESEKKSKKIYANKAQVKYKQNKSRGWKVTPYAGKRISDFTSKNELEVYRLYVLIKDLIEKNQGTIVDVEDYSNFYIIYNTFKLKVKLEILNDNYNGEYSGERRFKIRIGKKEDKVYSLLKSELLNYTYMMDGSELKLGDNTLIARVAYCDIKVDIEKSA